MPDYSGVYSDFLKAADLQGAARVLTIESVTLGTFKGNDGKDKEQPEIKFVGAKKTFGLNKTNYNHIASILGTPNTDFWIGKRIVLFPTMVDSFGKQVEAIRVRSVEIEREMRAMQQAAQQLKQQQPAQPGPRPVSQMLPAHDPNYVQTSVKRTEYDDVVERQYGPSAAPGRTAVDDLADDALPNDDLDADIPY